MLIHGKINLKRELAFCNAYNASCLCGASCESCSNSCLCKFYCTLDILKDALKKAFLKKEEAQNIHHPGMLLEERASLFYRSVSAWIWACRGGLMFIYYY